ncbi:hypothetical protein EON63_16795 [archaeon]|nr:MAG: hypothetical protein EON63_16795 [archaeon]
MVWSEATEQCKLFTMVMTNCHEGYDRVMSISISMYIWFVYGYECEYEFGLGNAGLGSSRANKELEVATGQAALVLLVLHALLGEAQTSGHDHVLATGFHVQQVQHGRLPRIRPGLLGRLHASIADLLEVTVGRDEAVAAQFALQRVRNLERLAGQLVQQGAQLLVVQAVELWGLRSGGGSRIRQTGGGVFQLQKRGGHLGRRHNSKQSVQVV